MKLGDHTDAEVPPPECGPVFIASFPGACNDCGEDTEGEECRMCFGAIYHRGCARAM